MNVEIINTGSELLLGRVLNTHQQWLCRRLADLGHVVTRQVAVSDVASEIQQAVREALNRSDLVITTGGLGPTSDDITRELIAELLGRKLVENAEVRAHIENRFARLGRPRPTTTRVEDFVPEGALVFLNAFGTAPGLAVAVDDDGRWKMEDGEAASRPSSILHPPSSTLKRKWLVMLPGPPRELRPMFDRQIVPFLKREFAAKKFVCRTLRTTGIGESRVQELVDTDLQPLMKCGLDVGYCARPGAVDVRLTAAGAGSEDVVQKAEAVVQRILGENIFGFDDEEMEQVVVNLLRAQRKTLALAESCTGGAIAQRVTDVPGASEIFPGGVVSYSAAAKEKFLGVNFSSLAAHGAVSEVVAKEMAVGARERFGTDFALAVTGLAGPGGGSVETPVGTVFIAMATPAGVAVRRFFNPWERATFKQVTGTQALEWLRQVISA